MAATNDHYRKITKEMQSIMYLANALVDATSGELDDRVKSARVALKERLESARSEYGAIEDRLLDKVHAADDLIHVKPYYAIGGTFIASLLLGWCMSRN